MVMRFPSESVQPAAQAVRRPTMIQRIAITEESNG